MAKARKEGKSKRNRANLVKKLRIINKNQEILKRLKESLNS
jgi:flagellin-specific chaperone FliS